MAAWLTRVCLALALMSGAARADDLADFNAAIEAFAAHNRVAIGYLRTEEIDLAVPEIEIARGLWAKFTERFGGKRPAAFASNPRYTEVLVDVPVRLVGVLLIVQMGRFDAARKSLNEVRKELSALRRASGDEVLADCILDFNAAVAPMAGWEDAPPNLADAARAADVKVKSDALAIVAKHCDALASPDLRNDPAFRRLIDGTLNSLDFLATAIATHDQAMLARVVSELRAFDNLLTFRYG